MHILVATDREVLVIDPERGTSAPARGIDDRPTCIAADVLVRGRAWCGTRRGGVFRSDDGGESWQPIGLGGRLIMAGAASSAQRDVVWAGTEPSEVWRSGNAGNSWEPTSDLTTLPSSSEWSFPPRPETHHVRWIACHPLEPERLWVAIEAGALSRSMVAAHGATAFRYVGHPRARPSGLTLRVSAGDGYYGVTTPAPRGTRPAWPRGRLRRVVIDASSRMSSSYQQRLDHTRAYRWSLGWPAYRRSASAGSGCATAGRASQHNRASTQRWHEGCELWAADERGVHRSDDGGKTGAYGYETSLQHLRGLALVRS
jgi:hypothetical protein